MLEAQLVLMHEAQQSSVAHVCSSKLSEDYESWVRQIGAQQLPCVELVQVRVWRLRTCTLVFDFSNLVESVVGCGSQTPVSWVVPNMWMR